MMRNVSPELGKWLENFNALLEKLDSEGFRPTPTNAREGLARLTHLHVTDRPDVAYIQDDLAYAPQYSVPVRIYNPNPRKELPVLAYFHGGGHIAGSVTVYDPICRKLANATQHIVISADYRLAPECPFPAGVNDACNTVKHLWDILNRRNIRHKRQLSIGGDSGGGALCATAAHRLQFDADADIRRQVLIYPSLDYTMTLKSIDENARGYLLQKDKMGWYFDNYFQNNENRKEVSPLYMEFGDNLPESLVITTEFCPLRDEGIAYCDKLRQHGIKVTHLHFDNMIHAFLNMENLAKKECETAYEAIGIFLNQAG